VVSAGYAEVELQPKCLGLSILSAWQVARWIQRYTIRSRGLISEEVKPMKNSMRLDKTCILVFYIGVYSEAANSRGQC
jgi:hypothetical protein